MGRAWLSLGQFLLSIYVPDKPVDPVAMATCAANYWRDEQNRLLAVMRHHTDLERRTTGNETNSVIEWLRTQAAAVAQELVSTTKGVIAQPRDVAMVHAFWAEVTHFLQEVLHRGKLEDLVHSLEAGAEGCQMREQVMQESISGFSQRLSAGYKNLRDVSAPLQWALFQIKFGLRIIACDTQISQDMHFEERSRFALSLVAFPSFHAVDLLCARPWQGSRHEASPATTLELYLHALAALMKSGVQNVARLDDLLEQVLRIWLKDRENEDRVANEAQSLYKSKAVDHDASSELEVEEREFRSLFPTYDDGTEGENIEPQSNIKKPILDLSTLQAIVRVFLDLFKGDEQILSHTNFNNLRRSLLKNTLSSHHLLPATLDNDGFASQLFVLRERSQETKLGSPSVRFDFYHDASMDEAEKATKIVRAMSSRIDELIHEWPDQMVLHHLRDRCQGLLNLSIVTPIAKILTSLEQLLLQSEDWEMYANRHNSLRSHREELTKIIVEWRRLELSCWSTLLQAQLQTFEDQSAEWWPNLYNACVRGALAVATEADAGGADRYLDELLPLVDNLLSSSPLGQFSRRIQLVETFERFLESLSPVKNQAEAAVLGRVKRILRSTRSYYQQFMPGILESFTQQRSALENDIRGFIKLASWKDVNVQALKASAVRTHHQLYKTIRKFREITRQPITEHFRLDPKHKPTFAISPLHLQISGLTLHDANLPGNSMDLSAPITDLRRTLSVFDGLLCGRIITGMESRNSTNVDQFAVEIIERSQQLERATIPANTPNEKRPGAQKSLLNLKRKAWIDLLKELKRIGLSAAIRPDVLELQRNLRWAREQSHVEDEAVPGVEQYFQRLQVILPELRQQLTDHHADLSTRDLHRAIMFIESCFSLAFQGRSR